MQLFLFSVYDWLKVIHLVAVIAWMCALMYLPRLFINHHQASSGGEAESFFINMERRLLKGIMTPAMIAVWILGILLLIANPDYLSAPWFIIKALFVLGITICHGFYAGAVKKFATGERPRTEKFWRMINEVPFLFMFIIVVMVLIKPF